MKLYYAPGACSLAPNIVAHEAGLAVELVKVDLARLRILRGGGDLAAVNPKKQVPTLELDDGSIITEVAVIVQYLGDLVPQTWLVPPPGTMARVRVQEWLNFVATELHKSFSPWLWHKDTAESTRSKVLGMLAERFALMDGRLADTPFLAGDTFTVADAYAYTIVNWSHYLKLDISAHANLTAYMARIAARPKVRAALEAEGLLRR